MTRELSRRHFLVAAVGLGASTAVASCAPAARIPVAGPVPTGPVSQDVTLSAAATQVDLAGRTATVWTYDGALPRRAIRARIGERVRITLRNDLPEETSIHWHGLAVPNAMDGVPGVTTPAVASGASFTYDFVVPTAGTHWFHPHTGLQLDTGLYAPFVVEDPADDADEEWILVLDDWTQGVGQEPQQIFDDLVAAGQRSRGGMMHGGMDHGMGMSGGDVTYPLFLINGRPAADPDALRVRPGAEVRLRIINAGADTVFRFAVGGHRLTVTHTDGFPIRPVEAPSLRIGMGERYDVTLRVGDGVFPVVAEPEGKAGYALAVLRSGKGAATGMGRPVELDAPAPAASSLRADPAVQLPATEPAIVHDVTLSGSMAPYEWRINGSSYGHGEALTVGSGEMLRLRMSNMTMMSHPMHLHGHTFQVGPAGAGGARKDTILLPPMTRADVDVVADNPGSWMLHCHNAYHAEAGMMTRLDYTT